MCKRLFSFAIILIGCSFISRSQNFQRIEDIAGLEVLKNNNGVAVADFDNDFDLDLFIVAKAKDNPDNPDSYSRLFRNNNDGSFTDITEQSGLLNLIPEDVPEQNFIGLSGFKYGVSWGDFDNDGYPDLFFTHISGIQLFHNNQDGTFSNITEQSGIRVDDSCYNTGATWLDYDNDGWLDIYINDWGGCRGNSLFKNNGNGTFRIINTPSPLKSDGKSRQSYAMVPYDFNNDGWLDLYVSNDFQEPNSLHINNEGKSFEEKANDFGIGNHFDDMGIALSDIDNDGDFDIFLTGILENALYINDGNNQFTEDIENYNIEETGWAWGCQLEDFDLDGDLDLFVANGFSQLIRPNAYYKNLLQEGENKFEEATSEVNLIDFTQSKEAASFDYDNDGDLDLYVSNHDRESYFYENNTEGKNWLKISLEGKQSNRNGFGAILEIKTNKGIMMKNYSGVGFLSQSIKPIHFGLDDLNSINELNIKWPSGIEETYTNISSNSWIKLTENTGIEFLNQNLSQKILGCTDPNSCTYNPDATSNDGSCEYGEISNILGETLSAFNNIESYSINLDNNSSAIWTVTGGEIIEGQGSESVKVKWGFYEKGNISVIKTNSTCNSKPSALLVQLSIDRIDSDLSIARLWNEALLEAIRNDFARPNVHARNLFHTSIAMYDSWAIYNNSKTYLLGKTINGYTSIFNQFKPNENIEQSLSKTISYAMYRVLAHRFKNSPGAEQSFQRFQLIMNQLNYEIGVITTDYTSGDAAALGNYIAETIIEYGLQDDSNEEKDYEYNYYTPVNNSLNLTLPGLSNGLQNPNRWQPLTFNTFIDQSGNLINSDTPKFLGPEWGNVSSFSLTDTDKVEFSRNGNIYKVYHDPGNPPYLNLNEKDVNSEQYMWNFSLVSLWSAHLDPSDGIMWDISPASLGNVDINSYPKQFNNYDEFYDEFNGGDKSTGRSINPKTGTPYQTQIVPRGDYTRVLAEFWADGPDSETPPGHWFTILNYVNDHEQTMKKLAGTGEELSTLEWDIKSYFTLGGAMHDAAISAWSVKGWYDYIRPISAIRYMSSLGQSSDENLPNYHVAGIPLKNGYIEIISDTDPIRGNNNQHVGKIKLKAWKGHNYISNPQTDLAGVDWILAENWWPYQKPSFVTPPFAGYVSGHSTFSRAAAEVLTLLTGDEYFPGGMGEFIAKKDDFLKFEKGPSVDVKLQWATYRDASDQTSLSRIWGGIHPPADDLLGREIGEKIGISAFSKAMSYFENETNEDSEITEDLIVFPNPAKGNEIYLQNLNQNSDIFLFNALGKIIPISISYNNESGLHKISINSLADGIYFLKSGNKAKVLFINN